VGGQVGGVGVQIVLFCFKLKLVWQLQDSQCEGLVPALPGEAQKNHKWWLPAQELGCEPKQTKECC